MKPNVASLLPEKDAGIFPFHYGEEADEYTFYRIPKLLFLEQSLKQLSTDAKLLYGLMLDRMSVSRKNGWLDENGRVFIYFSVEHIMEMIGCGNSKCTRLLQELDDKNGVGLITRVKQGLGKPDVIYVHKCIGQGLKSNLQSFQNDISGDVEMKSADISFCNPNKNNNNNTDFSKNNPIYSEGIDRNVDNLMDNRVRERESYRELVKQNIEYEIIVEPYNRHSLDEIVELMVDTICTTQEYIIIGGDRKPASVVKSQFLKLDSEHIRFVLKSMNEKTSRVRNIRKYLLSVLYNASMTIDNYYSALVNHDLYGQ